MAFLNEVVWGTVENPYTITGLKDMVAYMLLVLQLFKNMSANTPLTSFGDGFHQHRM